MKKESRKNRRVQKSLKIERLMTSVSSNKDMNMKFWLQVINNSMYQNELDHTYNFYNIMNRIFGAKMDQKRLNRHS